MTDTNVPAVEKVSGLGPDDSKPRVGAAPPEGQPFLAVCPPAPAHRNEKDEAGLTDKSGDKPAEGLVQSAGENKINGGTGHSSTLPKPVEVMSVPETPVNGSTPAGGTPRPELTISEDPAPSAPEPPSEPIIEPVEVTGAEKPKPAPPTSAPDEKHTSSSSDAPAPREEPVQQSSVAQAPEPPMNDSPASGAMDVDKHEEKQPAPVTHTGPESEPVPAPAPAPAEIPDAPPNTTAEPNDNAVGEKRKLDNVAPPVDGSSATAKDPAASDPLPVDKKPKLDGSAAANGQAAKAAATSDPASSADPASDPAPAETAKEPPQTSPRNGKPKKEKKLPPVGRTARKTRSQGPADA
ncbi:hypothetical protein H634G_02636 [Metarhizium anisopliae BRIP 53293]|uniref:Uncharacterized protein n=1 Tax=Metarhizium anisopliae BRIP 53293 TaxID=1291518 RepID=A0A0D9P847_METAN|nr:hypothetical protein H634G_02636 [Metarhizium anisopliae BRIP 53293]KJK88603.1 hypothetical protein H633G_07541 [Metarhizium anisopliae BRIP 53284]